MSLFHPKEKCDFYLKEQLNDAQTKALMECGMPDEWMKKIDEGYYIVIDKFTGNFLGIRESIPEPR